MAATLDDIINIQYWLITPYRVQIESWLLWNTYSNPCMHSALFAKVFGTGTVIGTGSRKVAGNSSLLF